MTKLPAVHEAVRNTPIAELASGLPAFNVRPAFDGYRSSSCEEAIQLDSYRIALVPSQSGGTTVANASRDGGRSNVLLLPFTLKEFVRQVCSQFGHSMPTQENSVMQFGNISVDLLAMEAREFGRPVNMTAMEFKVLKFFVLNPYRVITRDELLNQVWGYDHYPCTRTVDNHVLKLRQKLEAETANPVHFRTVHGVGYKFVP